MNDDNKPPIDPYDDNDRLTLSSAGLLAVFVALFCFWITAMLVVLIYFLIW